MRGNAAKFDSGITGGMGADAVQISRNSAFFGRLRNPLVWLLVAAVLYVVLNVVVAPAGFIQFIWTATSSSDRGLRESRSSLSIPYQTTSHSCSASWAAWRAMRP